MRIPYTVYVELCIASQIPTWRWQKIALQTQIAKTNKNERENSNVQLQWHTHTHTQKIRRKGDGRRGAQNRMREQYVAKTQINERKERNKINERSLNELAHMKGK